MNAKLALLLVAVAASSLLQGCAQLMRDSRDAPWDPRPGQTLMDQIPNHSQGGQDCCGWSQNCEAERLNPRC
jgi:hypothetical protein